jgi:hypothetical protein
VGRGGSGQGCGGACELTTAALEISVNEVEGRLYCAVFGGQEAKVKRSWRGSLPRLWWSSGRRLDGVMTVGSSPAQRRPAVALPNGSPTKARGKTGSWRFGDAPHPDGQVREGANR